MFLFTRENAMGVTRTVVTFVYAWILEQVGAIDWLMDALPDVPTESWIVIIGGLLYQAIRWLAEKWGWVGRLLIFNQKPEYPTA